MGGCYNNNSKNQDDTCVIIFFFLTPENFEKLTKNIKDISANEVMIFSSLKINEHKIFISNGENLTTKEQYDLYLQSCNLEGEIKQIFAMIDQDSFDKFKKSSFYEYISTNQDLRDFTTYIQIEMQCEINEQQNQFNNLKVEANVQNLYLDDFNWKFLNFQKNNNMKINCQVSQFMNQDIFIEDYTQNLEQQHKNVSSQCKSVKDIDILYQWLIKTRNKLLYDCSSLIDKNTQIHYNAISLKFNTKILDFIGGLTSDIFEEIKNLQDKFKKFLICCNKCKSIHFYQQSSIHNYQQREVEKKRMISSRFHNLFQKNCECKATFKLNEMEINKNYNFKLQLFNISPIQKRLMLMTQTLIMQQNIIIETPKKIEKEETQKLNQVITHNSQSNLQDLKDQQRRIMFIGKRGVGKRIIFNKLCSIQSQHKNNQDKFEVYEQQCKNNLFQVMNTPAFELKNEQEQLDQQQIKNFGKLIASTKINQIFIVTNYDRIENMKMKIMECYKYLEKFKSKISIIVMILNEKISESSLQNDLSELQNEFDAQNWLHFNLNDKENIVIDQITKSIESTYESFLDINDTIFDRTKLELTEHQFGQNLEKIKNNKLMVQKQEHLKLKKASQKQNQQKQYQLIKQMDSLFQQFTQIYEQIQSNIQQIKDIAQEDHKVSQEIFYLESQILEWKSDNNINDMN